MYNTMSINPSCAGSREVFSVGGLYRSQWVGLEGAPKTASINFDTPIESGIGFGLSILNEKIGPSDENDINVNVSYNDQCPIIINFILD